MAKLQAWLGSSVQGKDPGSCVPEDLIVCLVTQWTSPCARLCAHGTAYDGAVRLTHAMLISVMAVSEAASLKPSNCTRMR